MNREAIGAVGEIVGAGAVAMTPVYRPPMLPARAVWPWFGKTTKTTMRAAHERG